MLVDGGDEVRADQRAWLTLGVRLNRLRLHDPGELRLELDRAVEVEVPEEAVLVVADG